MRNATLSLCFALLVGCGDDEEKTPPIQWPTECAGTADTNACLQLTVTATNSVITNAPGDLVGPLSWALYNDGDVDLTTGPKTDPAHSGDVASADVSDGHNVVIDIPNLPAQKMHVLMQLDDDESGGPNDGDCVTLPAAAFNLPAGEQTKRNIALQLVCTGGICNQ